MNTTDIEGKVEQYEKTAVQVANEMYNPNMRAESSKEVLESFPNVRLASEKKEISKKEGRGRAFLSSLLLSTAIGACCFGAGYKTKDYVTPTKEKTPIVAQIPAIPALPPIVQENASFKKTIEDIVTKDVGSGGLVFLGSFEEFVPEYGITLFGRKPDEQQLQALTEYLQTHTETVQAHKINGIPNNRKESLVYRKSWR